MTKKGFLASVLVFLSVLVISVMLLGMTWIVAKPRIEESRYKLAEAERSELLPSAGSFDELTGLRYVEGVQAVYEAKHEAGYSIGYVFEVVSSGSSGDTDVLVAIGSVGNIQAVKVRRSAGLPVDLGFKVAEEAYLSQYIGAKAITTDPSTVGGKLIMPVEGADDASAAVFSCVSIALQQYARLHSVPGGGQ